ncbi:multidrug effflux MFS transporter [Rhodococcus sp. BP-252]|uniref:Bcr/CflA family drug resistance efflux transporter n=1 Tax=Rhodococcoides kyotonense TaxID=398843 RepID=A0A177Y7S1_9NOCA|nr:MULTISPECIES: multidrug effflux MFS transporter [Rhodococcus]MBY6413453.1 multidrug effflux MFS transporter [Rhodococcus sp. BP-320]MBY6418147.1 multidrug effflux MFS transporter [Rhodococcus sp. BP-321]MBY6422372.1 multidrug effflux MFS transporter [Rhodococcus sp. BP-324]MBY6428647.1 multidrug effflux MFS transporter [Rhodococcus sp. BP-323]MBY6433653.1 multidrug effflux MFS transporter [Rhodococcus sp. BP-322]
MSTTQTAPKTLTPPSGLLVCVLALLTAIPPLATDMYLPGFPAMAEELSTSASSIQLTLTTFLIGLALGQLVIGPLSDKLGRRVPLIVGSAVCLVAGTACALAPSIDFLIGARFVQGFAGAAGVVLSRAIIADRTEGSRSAKLFGLMMIIGGVAPVIAPLIGGAVVDSIGWRGVFWIITGLTALMLVSAIAFVPESLHPHARRGGGLTDMITGIGSVLRNPRYVGYTLTFTFAFSVMFAYISASPFVLQNMLGLSAGQYSAAFAVNALGLMIGSAITAKLADRMSLHRMMTGGICAIVVTTAALMILVLIGISLWPTLVLLFSTLVSLGFVFANATSLAVAQVPHLAGTGSAVLGALQFGLAAVVSPLVGLGGEHTAIPMVIAMLAGAIIAAGACLFASRIRDSDQAVVYPSTT